MELKVIRKEFASDYCIGELLIDGKPFCHTIEDTDRGLTSDMSLDKIKDLKIAKETCIPYGRYRTILSYSVKLKRYLPLLLDVRGYRGIRFHRGSGANYSSGCICLGFGRKGNRLTGYKEAEKDFIAVLDKINKTEAIYTTIVKA